MPHVVADSAEFQPYIDAVTKSGERTRGAMYVLGLVVFFTVCGIRNFIYPDWDERRLEAMMSHYRCFEEANRSGADCVEYMQNFEAQHKHVLERDADGSLRIINGQPRVVDKGDIGFEVYKDRFHELVKRDLSDTVLQIPIFGVSLDGNDLWLVSGLLTGFLLLILLAHLQRGFANFRIAAAACPNNSCRDLLTMAQVFALPVEHPIRSLTSIKHLILFIFFLPALLHLIVVEENFVHNSASIALIGSPVAWLQFIARIALALIVIYLCYRCYRVSAAGDHLVADVSVADFPSPDPKRWWPAGSGSPSKCSRRHHKHS